MSCNGCDDGSGLLHAMAAIGVGMFKVAKAILGADAAPKEVIEQRRAICRDCVHAVPCQFKPSKRCWCGPVWDGVWGKRETCGCNIEYKTMLASEQCPKLYWPSVSAKGSINPSPASDPPQTPA